MTISHNSFRERLLLAAACGLVALAAGPTHAWAQAAVAPPAGTDIAGAAVGTPAATEEVVVTGSRLKHSDVTSEAPVTVVSAEQIKHTGAQTIEDVLQKLPAIGTGGIYGTTTNGGEGASCTDIRNLGPDRTLVLIDGKRAPQTEGSTFSCVDLNNIPVALVDRIEVLKDGASAVYGADAVAGVVNIILKKNFSGTTITADGGIAGAGDDRTGDLSFTSGQNFDKGNITFSGGYENREPIAESSRNWSHNVLLDNNQHSVTSVGSPFYLGRVGSAILPDGLILDTPNNDLTDAYGALVATGGTNTKDFSSRTDRFNWGNFQQLQTGLERWNIGATTNYEITPEINFYAKAFYAHVHSTSELAPDPVSQAYPGDPLYTDLIVPAGNPYVQALFPGTTEDVALYKRFADLGGRNYIQDSDTFHITTGFNGTVADDWDYEVFFNYGRSQKSEVEENIVNFNHLEQELGFHQTNDLTPYITSGQLDSATSGTPTDAGFYDQGVCNAAAGCRLYNPFGPPGTTGNSAQALAYLRVNNNQSTLYTLRQFGGNISNDNLYQLPYGPVGLSLGVENRSESGSYTPDSIVLAGETSDPPVNPTSGGYSTTEVFGEVRVPILKDLPFAKDLHVDLSGRFFHYNTFGNGKTWKIAGNYSPSSDIRFRASLGTAFRQPTINDLYGGGTVSYESAADPCSTPATGNAAANCAAQHATGVVNVNGQVPTEINLGNPNLKPETARTYTIGAVVTPSFLPRFSLTADFYHTRIENEISALTAPTILNLCYNSPGFSSAFCSQVLPRNGLGQLSLVNSPTLNLGEVRTDGLDIGLNYVYPVPGGYGAFTFSNDLAFVFAYLEQDARDLPFVQYAGQSIIGGQAFPRRRDNFATTWSFDNFSLGYRMRYISGMSLDYSNTQNGFDHPLVVDTREVFYHDIFASYQWRNIDATVGIDNVGDIQPPYAPDGYENTNANIYDVVGRYFYVKTSVHF